MTLRSIRKPARGARHAGRLAALALFVALAGCGGGGGGEGSAVLGSAEERTPRPAVTKEVVEGIQGPAVDGVAGQGYVLVCPGRPDDGLPRNVLVLVGGFSPNDTDRRPAAGELDRDCGNVGTDNDHHTLVVRYRNGSDAIQRNAGFVRAVLEWATDRYRLVATDRIVLQGVSMGGVVTRYALQSMETDGRAHLVDLWVSVDAPQRGAYIPIGMQHLADLYRDRGGAAALATIDTPAARQLLTHHYRQRGAAQTGTDEHRRLYRDELAGTLGGFPKAAGLRRVGVASGRSGDALQAPLPGERYVAGRLQVFTKSLPVRRSAAAFPCELSVDVTLPIVGTLVLEAFPLGLQANQATRVADSRVDTTVAGFDIDTQRARLVDYIDDRVVVSGALGLCNAFIASEKSRIVSAAGDGAIAQARSEVASLVTRYERSFSAYGDGIHAEGAPGGRSNYVEQLRTALTAAGFSSEPGVTGGGRHLFVSVASALDIPMSTGRIPPEGLRDASPFDEVYVEPARNLDHADTSSGYFAKEVLALFGR